MRSIRKTILFIGTFLFLAVLVFPVAAQIDTVDGDDFGIASGTNVGAAGNYILRIVNTALVLVGIIAAIFLIYGGIQYITAGGDENKAEEGKKTILYAIIGLLIIGLAAAIVNFVVSAIR